ncbi:hypothetical protein DBV15_09942 [Temnothorax longispinosus]|uniref:Uncharacterized protein n=1 Tax=Temnothorax longispinosus TaxID=300112 RepID=A0A4S2KU25_9HYME|nr:hypothetical protein DBV15_09942 [Temnothorax longispinosus]
MLEQGETTALRQRSCTTKLHTATRGRKNEKERTFWKFAGKGKKGQYRERRVIPAEWPPESSRALKVKNRFGNFSGELIYFRVGRGDGVGDSVIRVSVIHSDTSGNDRAFYRAALADANQARCGKFVASARRRRHQPPSTIDRRSTNAELTLTRRVGSSNRKEEVLVIAVEKEDPRPFTCASFARVFSTVSSVSES